MRLEFLAENKRCCAGHLVSSVPFLPGSQGWIPAKIREICYFVYVFPERLTLDSLEERVDERTKIVCGRRGSFAAVVALNDVGDRAGLLVQHCAGQHLWRGSETG